MNNAISVARVMFDDLAVGLNPAPRLLGLSSGCLIGIGIGDIVKEILPAYLL